MINISFNLRNPRSDLFRNIYSRHGELPFKYKFWEVQIMRGPDIVDFALEITRRQDHAGFRLAFGLLSWNFDFNVYDSRHWDPVLKDWYRYEQDY